MRKNGGKHGSLIKQLSNIWCFHSHNLTKTVVYLKFNHHLKDGGVQPQLLAEAQMQEMGVKR